MEVHIHRLNADLKMVFAIHAKKWVTMSDWAAPIVPVLKPDSSIRICGDYKFTINKAAKQDVYPLPRVEDLFTTLAGGKSFTKLDLAHAYTQIPLDEASKRYVTINTHKGLQITIWCISSTLYLPENNGRVASRNTPCIHIIFR